MLVTLLMLSMSFTGSPAEARQTESPGNVFDAREQAFVLGLKQRRLFGIAEDFCDDTLQRDDISATDQAALTVELIQIRTQRATVAKESEQEAAWEAVWQTEVDFDRQFPNHDRQILVSVQTGLAHLRRAQRVTSAMKARMFSGDALSEAKELVLGETRLAKRIFTDVERKIERLLPEQRSKSLTVHDLSPQELLTLKSNVRFQIAVCQLETVSVYDVEDEANRISTINDVRRRLQEVQDSVVPSQSIWWLSRVAQLKCLRLLGNYMPAKQILATLPKEPPAEVFPMLLAERLRLAMAALEMETLKFALGDDPKPSVGSDGSVLQMEQSPELAIVKIEAALLLSNRSNDARVQSKWLEYAASKKRFVETNFGGYWGRRASLALIGTSAGESITQSNSANLVGGRGRAAMNDAAVEILIQTAQQSERQGNLDDAIKAYDSAIAQIEKAAPGAALNLQVSVSQILERQKLHSQTAARLMNGALKIPRNEAAAAVHLRGVWNLAQAIAVAGKEPDSGSVGSGGSDSGSDLSKSLKLHLATWPASPTANQAALWLMSEQILQNQIDDALITFDKIAIDSNSFSAALQQIRRMYLQFERSQRTPSGKVFDQAAQFGDRLVDRLLERYEQLDQPLSATESTTESEARKASLLSGAIEIGLRSGGSSLSGLQPWVDRFSQTNGNAWQQRQPDLLRWAVLLRAQARGSAMGDDDLENAAALLKSSKPTWQDCQRLFSAFAIVELRLEQQGENLRLAELRKFGLEIVAIAKRLPLSVAQMNRWTFQQGRLRRVTGSYLDAVSILEPLSQRFTTDALIQLEFARALSKIEDRNADAIAVWRRLVKVLTPRSENWYEAKLNVVIGLQKSGEREMAKKTLRYLRSVYGWKDSVWANELDRLLRTL